MLVSCGSWKYRETCQVLDRVRAVDYPGLKRASALELHIFLAAGISE